MASSQNRGSSQPELMCDFCRRVAFAVMLGKLMDIKKKALMRNVLERCDTYDALHLLEGKRDGLSSLRRRSKTRYLQFLKRHYYELKRDLMVLDYFKFTIVGYAAGNNRHGASWSVLL